jgi:hypothetical protein
MTLTLRVCGFLTPTFGKLEQASRARVICSDTRARTSAFELRGSTAERDYIG